jgi:hypothetical protein
MFIKSITKKGQPVPFTPKECLERALTLGLKNEATAESDKKFIFFLTKSSAVATQFAEHPGPVTAVKKSKAPALPSWIAVASGTCLLGKHDVAKNRFYKAKSYAFQITYASGKDALGIPDVSVTTCAFTAVETNPGGAHGPRKTNPPVVVGELTPQPGGLVAPAPDASLA